MAGKITPLSCSRQQRKAKKYARRQTDRGKNLCAEIVIEEVALNVT
jgi:hypothetical protein